MNIIMETVNTLVSVAGRLPIGANFLLKVQNPTSNWIPFLFDLAQSLVVLTIVLVSPVDKVPVHIVNVTAHCTARVFDG